MVELRRVSSKNATTCAIDGCEGERSRNHKNACLCVLHLKVHRALNGAKSRCESRNNVAYANYGGRGIRCRLDTRYIGIAQICDAIGAPPTLEHSLDRIDPNGDYEIGNLRWATSSEQKANQRAPTTSEWQTLCARFGGLVESLMALRA